MLRYRIYVFIVFLVVFTPLLHSSIVNESLFLNSAQSKLKILVIMGHLGKSHFQTFKPLFEELARRGHYLTVLSHFPRSEAAKMKEALTTYKDISLLNSEVGTFIDVIDIRITQQTLFFFAASLYKLRQAADIECRIFYNNQAIKKLYRSNDKFDIILTESFSTDCFLSFIARFKIPHLTLSTILMPWTSNDIGNEDNPSYIPIYSLGLTRPLDYIDRIANTLVQLICKITYDYWYRPKDQTIIHKLFSPGVSNLKEIAKQSMAVFVNTHSSLHGNVPRLPNVIEVGGIHIPTKINPLPKDIAEFLDSASDGLLYFNFGSMIKMTTMPQEKLNAILEVFVSLPRKIIWKWEDDLLPRKMNNVMVKKWLPQFDILSKLTYCFFFFRL